MDRSEKASFTNSRSRVASPAPRAGLAGDSDSDWRRSAGGTSTQDENRATPFFGIVGYVVGRVVGSPVYISGLFAYVVARPIIFVLDIIRAILRIVLFIPWLIFDIIMFIPRAICRLCACLALYILALCFVAFLAFFLTSFGDKVAGGVIEATTLVIKAAYPAIAEHGRKWADAAGHTRSAIAVLAGQTLEATRAHVDNVLPLAFKDAWINGSLWLQGHAGTPWTELIATELAAFQKSFQSVFGHVQDQFIALLPGVGVSTETMVLAASLIMGALALYLGWRLLELLVNAAFWILSVCMAIVMAPLNFVAGIVRGIYDSTLFWRAVLRLRVAI